LLHALLADACARLLGVYVAQGEHDVEVYVGLKKIVVTYDDETESTLWTDASCSDDYCDQCKRACQRSAMVAIVALLTSLPQVTTDFVRARAASDLNCQVMGSLRPQSMTQLSCLTTELATAALWLCRYWDDPNDNSLALDMGQNGVHAI
jgi:hypothetical protein